MRNMEKHDIWIQINPKPTHVRSLWMNQMKRFLEIGTQNL